MKRILFLIITVLSSAVAVMAQEVLVVKMKDGREFSFQNGIEHTNVYFWGTATEGEERAEFTASDYSTQWQPELEGLRVADYSRLSGQYAVAIAWPRMSDLPTSARVGICIGREPNVSAEHCDTTYYPVLSENNASFAEQLLPREQPEHIESCYVLMGDSVTFFRGNINSGKRKWAGTRVPTGESNYDYLPWIDYPLTKGETYYYRIVASLPYNQPYNIEEPAEALFYGPEMSFRVPNLKADAGYDNGDIYFSDEAWASFMQHFPADMSTSKQETWKTMLRSLQHKWEATLDASPYDLSTSTKLTFDDGVAYVLPEVPEAFYTWMSTRELVINAATTELYSSKMMEDRYNIFEMVPITSFEVVDNIDAAWEIPSNSYVVCTPVVYKNTSNLNSSVNFNFTEAVPGLRYRLTITLAPETRFTPEKDDEGNYIGENASHFQPVPIRISYGLLQQTSNSSVASYTPWGYVPRYTIIKINGMSSYETAATAKDVVEIDDEQYDFSCSVLNIQSSAAVSKLRNGLQTNELHIAEVRLTPIPNNEEEASNS